MPYQLLEAQLERAMLRSYYVSISEDDEMESQESLSESSDDEDWDNCRSENFNFDLDIDEHPKSLRCDHASPKLEKTNE